MSKGQEQISVLIADDQEIIIAGLSLLIGRQNRYRVIGQAENGKLALEKTRALKPHVVLMDLYMPVMGGIEATRLIINELPDTKVIMFTTFESDEDVFGSFAAGAHGYCLKAASQEQIISAMDAVLSGATWLDSTIAAKVLRNSNYQSSGKGDKANFELTEREMDVLRLLVEGLSNQAIASALFVSPDTIKTHMRHIMEKLKVSDRTQAAVKAMKEGLF